MLLQSVGSSLPAALAVALSPFPVIGVVLILGGPRGRRDGPFFALGWIVGLVAVAALVSTVFSGTDDPDSDTALVADVGRVVVGGLLMVLGARKWLSRPEPGETVEQPGWMAALDHTTPVRALGLGILLSGANPKNFVLTAAATTSMVETGASGSDLAIAIAVFVFLASTTVIGAVALRLIDRPGGLAFLESVRDFMVKNSTVITVLILLILGANILGDGLAGLGR